MTYKKRIDTLRVLVGGNQILASSGKLNALYGEFNGISASRRRSGHGGWLLSVVHTTRALDTSLSEIIAGMNWSAAGHSLGGYLKVLEDRSVMEGSQRSRYQKVIVDKRNRYMHEAGAMPQEMEADRLLADMQECLESVVRRVP